jgi:hypothetical protein
LLDVSPAWAVLKNFVKMQEIQAMKDYLSNLQREYERQLREAALEYLRVGLDLFHRYREELNRLRRGPIPDPARLGLNVPPSPQVSLANLAISVELMLKAMVARKHLPLIFRDLPDQVRVLWACPESLPRKFNRLAFETYLKSKKCQTIDFVKCLSLSYTLFPDLKDSLHPYLGRLSVHRNTSVHFVLPQMHILEAERAAFAAMRVHEILASTLQLDEFPFPIRLGTGFVPSKEDEKFVSSFQAERSDRVRRKVNEAKNQSGKAAESVTPPTEDWEHLIIRCPVCKNDAVLAGHTELSEFYYDEDEVVADLTFLPDAFSCSYCKLSLDDVDEMQLVDISPHFSREDEFDRYLEEVVDPSELA